MQIGVSRNDHTEDLKFPTYSSSTYRQPGVGQSSGYDYSPGDALFLFSDGISEAENDSHELFGTDRLINHIEHQQGSPWGQGLLDAVNGWRGTAEVNDDLTILEIWRNHE